MAAAINAKSEALKLHELSFEELDAASGGDKHKEHHRKKYVQPRISRNVIKDIGIAGTKKIKRQRQQNVNKKYKEAIQETIHYSFLSILRLLREK